MSAFAKATMSPSMADATSSRSINPGSNTTLEIVIRPVLRDLDEGDKLLSREERARACGRNLARSRRGDRVSGAPEVWVERGSAGGVRGEGLWYFASWCSINGA